LKSGGDVGFDVVAHREILNRGANTEIFTALIGFQLIEFFAVEITRVRIERPQHPHNRRFIDVVVIELVPVNVFVLNNFEGFLKVIRHRSGGGIAEVSASSAGDRWFRLPGSAG
jgi:hypothetical protein